MTQENKHINHKAIDKQSKAFFSDGNFYWDRSKSDVWSTMESKMDDRPNVRSIFSNYKSIAYAAAAILL